MSKTFKKILIANRGEITSRIIRSLKEAGKKTVAIYSDVDRFLPYVGEADEAWPLGEGTLADTYLNSARIIQIARTCSADAIHPGYGFLSENEEFASLCEKEGIAFIGPDPTHIHQMGNKANARKLARQFGVPVLSSHQGNASDLLKTIPLTDYPLLIKPAAGGGGKGMKLVEDPSVLENALNDAAREALTYFGSAELYIEKYIRNARHIEIQVLGDTQGNYIHLFERECSIQRRHQKVIEEAPSVSISERTRKALVTSALALIKGISYVNAGTIEFLLDEHDAFYFIEMNTRIQVEHPVTEAVTGIDIVREQVRIAEGLPISFRQEDVKINGHAIEARIYAEDPDNSFMPSSGKIKLINTDMLSSRIDGTYTSGSVVSPFYDPMIAKVIAHASNRDDAASLLSRDLENFFISGIKTNRLYLQELLNSSDFLANKIYTAFLDTYSRDETIKLNSQPEEGLAMAVMSVLSLPEVQNDLIANPWSELGYWRAIREIGLSYDQEIRKTRILFSTKEIYEVRSFTGIEYAIHILQQHKNLILFKAGNDIFQAMYNLDLPGIHMQISGREYFAERIDILPSDTGYLNKKENQEQPGQIHSPIQGKVVKLSHTVNTKVKKGDTLLVVESMKMENKILAPRDAEIENIFVNIGDLVKANELIISLKDGDGQ